MKHISLLKKPVSIVKSSSLPFRITALIPLGILFWSTKIFVNHLGYLSNANKGVVVDGGIGTTSFDVVDPGGKVAFSGDLKSDGMVVQGIGGTAKGMPYIRQGHWRHCEMELHHTAWLARTIFELLPSTSKWD